MRRNEKTSEIDTTDQRSETRSRRRDAETRDVGSWALSLGVEGKPEAPISSFQSLPLPGTLSALLEAPVPSPPSKSYPLRIGPRPARGRGLEGFDVTGRGAGS